MAENPTPTVQAILNKASLDKFRMVLNLPPILQNLNTSNQKDRTGKKVNLDALQFAVHGSVVPASYVPHVEVRHGGQTVKVTSYSRPSYANISVGFVVDNGFRNYFVMWKWLQLLNNEKKSIYNADRLASFIKLHNRHQYMAELSIFAKDEYERDIAKFTYTNCFITRLEGIEYSHQNPEQIESKFEFAFSQLEMELL